LFNLSINIKTSKNDYFTIERSADGLNWEFVCQQSGAGYSSQVLNYADIDYTPLNGVSYYRLKQTDYDGQFTYSNIIFTSCTDVGNGTLVVFPNPASIFRVASGKALSSVLLAKNAASLDTELKSRLRSASVSMFGIAPARILPNSPKVGLFAFAKVPEPDITVHVPVPEVAVLPASVAELPHTVWSPPAFDIVGPSFTVTTTSVRVVLTQFGSELSTASTQ
jgi:hypothetical protein